ncbi:hypothetical protein GF406_21035 [candidate division KSB1 bacterium]|nr:hypothetical protein [candidate division KSB1 bacterium]
MKFVQLPEIGHKSFNINFWSEWTNGSYLEPDTTHGRAYLQAIRAVFGSEQGKNS